MKFSILHYRVLRILNIILICVFLFSTVSALIWTSATNGSDQMVELKFLFVITIFGLLVVGSNHFVHLVDHKRSIPSSTYSLIIDLVYSFIGTIILSLLQITMFLKDFDPFFFTLILLGQAILVLTGMMALLDWKKLKSKSK